jgi:hypothetical protein
MLNNKIVYVIICFVFIRNRRHRDQISRMFKNDGRVNSPLNKSPMSTKSLLAIATACLDNSSSVRLSKRPSKGRPWIRKLLLGNIVTNG